MPNESDGREVEEPVLSEAEGTPRGCPWPYCQRQFFPYPIPANAWSLHLPVPFEEWEAPSDKNRRTVRKKILKALSVRE